MIGARRRATTRRGEKREEYVLEYLLCRLWMTKSLAQ
jgi:hypothetical protein